MNQWEADFGNDPYNDYNLIVEILCDDEEIAVVKNCDQGLIMTMYPNNKELSIPVDWLLELLLETKRRLK